MEISHEDLKFITILKEKDKYEKMKGNLRSENQKYEIMRLSSMKLLSILCRQKNYYFSCVCIKCFKSERKNTKKYEVEIIGKGGYFWVNRKYLEVGSDSAYWPQIIDKCDPEKQKYQQELTPNAE